MKDKPEEKKSQIKGFKKLGYIRFWRGSRDDPIWKEKRKFSQFEARFDLYLEASGIDRDFIFRKRVIKLKRGQLVVSQRELARRWNWTRGSVENYLRKLESIKTIYVEARKGPPCSIITFLNYNENNPRKQENEK